MEAPVDPLLARNGLVNVVDAEELMIHEPVKEG
jgi:hypothetical protein